MFNEIDANYNDVTISTFKANLPAEHDLRKSLMDKPVASVRQLVDWIDRYRRVDEDQVQGKGKAKVIPQEMKVFRSDWFHNNRPRKDFVGQPGSADTQAVNAVFREPVQRVLEKIKNEPFFKWSNKMAKILWGVIKAFIAIIIRTIDTLLRIVETCGTIWTNWSEKGN